MEKEYLYTITGPAASDIIPEDIDMLLQRYATEVFGWTAEIDDGEGGTIPNPISHIDKIFDEKPWFDFWTWRQADKLKEAHATILDEIDVEKGSVTITKEVIE